MTEKILLVEDELALRETISYNLKQQGYEVVTAEDGEQAIEQARNMKPDLMLLDLMLPNIDGFEVCRILRREMNMPILMLTARSSEIDRVLGLEMGADDYITKPFSVKELVARVRAMLRRSRDDSKQSAKEKFSYRGLQIDYTSYTVTADGKKVTLSPTEIKLLFFFTQHPGRVYSRDQILDYVWGDDTFVTPRAVDVHIKRLRSQIEKDADNPQYIITVRGIGYKFVETK